MGSNIRINRTEPCKNNVGGINSVYFVNYGEIKGVTYSSNGAVITSVDGTPAAFKFNANGSSSYSETIKSSSRNGTTFYEQNLKITLPKLSEQDQISIDSLAKGRPNIIIQDNNGNLFLSGLDFGSNMIDSNVITGENMLDLSGYVLNFKAMEKFSSKFLYRTNERQSDGDALSRLGFAVAYSQSSWDYYHRVVENEGFVESLLCLKK